MKTKVFLGTAVALLAVSVPTAPVFARSKAKNNHHSINKAARSAVHSWVTLTASTDQKIYTPGQPIQVRLKATNTHKRGAFLRFTSGQRFDFSVYPLNKKEAVYTWSASRMFLQALGSLWIKPGQSQNFEAAVGDEMGQLKPGKYRLLARLTNSPRPIVASPIYFEVSNQKVSQSESVSVTAQTDKTTYKVGEPVHIEVVAANLTGKEQRLQFEGGLDCDVVISDESGRPIWTYGANLRFIRALGEVTWQKGETKNYTRTWDGIALPQETVPTTLKSGRYSVQAFLASTPQVKALPIYIQITR
ncbi:MAG TPA: BsuPI-related putative proteinase inhibitor [Abditibacteriaceae bacterium]|jgi:hypothetical protein